MKLEEDITKLFYRKIGSNGQSVYDTTRLLDELEYQQIITWKEKADVYDRYKPIFDHCIDPDVLIEKVNKNTELEAEIKQLKEELELKERNITDLIISETYGSDEIQSLKDEIEKLERCK